MDTFSYRPFAYPLIGLILDEMMKLYTMGTIPTCIHYNDGRIEPGVHWVNLDAKEAYEKLGELLRIEQNKVLEDQAKRYMLFTSS